MLADDTNTRKTLYNYRNYLQLFNRPPILINNCSVRCLADIIAAPIPNERIINVAHSRRLAASALGLNGNEGVVFRKNDINL